MPSTIINTSTLTLAQGFTVQGSGASDFAGGSVSDAGDINGDGIDDFIVGAGYAVVGGLAVGKAYVIFGKTQETRDTINLTSLAATDGFEIQGDQAFDAAGSSVSSAGDINGDGVDDLVVGAPAGDNGGSNAGEAYVIFGKLGATRANIALGSLAPADGFIIQGDVTEDRVGGAVSSAGDINGDGLADLIIGAYFGDNGGTEAGEAYVIFGKVGATRTNIDLTTLATTDGFIVQGNQAGDLAGNSVSLAGDVNGDGFDDFIIGASRGDTGGLDAGEAYVIFGKAGATRGNIDLTGLAAADGFIVRGDVAGDSLGFSVSSAGDINGDGFGDLIIGALGGDNGGYNAGETYVIFGKMGATRANIDVTTLTATDGFIIQGDAGGDRAAVVSSIGDFNGDGLSDVLIGAPRNDNGAVDGGEAYVIFGKTGATRANIDLTNLSSSEGIIIRGGAYSLDGVGFSVSSAGDINGDGLSDIIVGAPLAAGYGGYDGKAYVIYGDYNLQPPSTIIGTAVSETINGTAIPNIIYGIGGDDIINGLTGNDALYGGDGTEAFLSGNDTLNGGAGTDSLFGGDGNDILIGGTGADTLSGGAGNDTAIYTASISLVVVDLTAGTGAGGDANNDTLVDVENVTGSAFQDTLTGNAFANILNGGAGSDVLYGGGGADTINGGDGDDFIQTADVDGDVIDGGLGNDRLSLQLSGMTVGVSINLTNVWGGGVGSFGSGTIRGIEGFYTDPLGVTLVTGTGFDDSFILGAGLFQNVTLSAGLGNDVLRGGSGNDILSGGDGNDTIEGGAGGDELSGNAGIDTLSYASSIAAVSVNLLTEMASGGDAQSDSIKNFDNLTGSEQGDTLTGAKGANTIIGGGGDDVIDGGEGNDVLVGGIGNDSLDGGIGLNTLIGGAGDDLYLVSVSGNSIVEAASEGIDEVRTTFASATLSANVEYLTYVGADAFIGNGNAGDNVISGGAKGDQLSGFDGNDRLSGGVGTSNTLIGGLGNDIYTVDVLGDSTIEASGQGIDEVRTTFTIYGLQANVENLTYTDNGAHGAGVGNILDNVITGGTGIDSLFGRAGNDTLRGGAGSANTLLGQEGDDIYVIEAAGDSVIEFASQGIDTVQTARASFVLRAHVENLTYTGTGTFTGVGAVDNNQLTGGAGADFLSGLEGNDMLIGKAGADFLLGGSGSDQYRYEGGETGFDRISDFVSGIDKIALRDAGFAQTATIALVQSGAPVATTTNSTFLYNVNNGMLSFDADGTGAGAAVVLAQLNAGLTLAPGDFLFY